MARPRFITAGTWIRAMLGCGLILMAWASVEARADDRDDAADASASAQLAGQPGDWIGPVDDGGWDERGPIYCPASWTAGADLLFWQRTGGRSVGLIFGDGFLGVPGNPGPEILNARDLTSRDCCTPDLEPGVRVSLARCRDSDRCWEAVFLAIDSWLDAAHRAAPMHVTFPGFVQAFLPPPGGIGTFSLGSDLYSTELHLRLRTGDWFTLLAGFRWIELHDQLSFQFQPNGGASATMYTIDANNHLYGLQIGGAVDLWNSGLWSINGWVKAGVYHNSADQLTSVYFPAVGTVGDQDDHTAFAGDVTISAVRQLNDWLSLRLGYQLLWISGVALASDQLLGTNDVTVPIAVLETGGDAFYHGLLIGLEASW